MSVRARQTRSPHSSGPEDRRNAFDSSNSLAHAERRLFTAPLTAGFQVRIRVERGQTSRGRRRLERVSRKTYDQDPLIDVKLGGGAAQRITRRVEEDGFVTSGGELMAPPRAQAR